VLLGNKQKNVSALWGNTINTTLLEFDLRFRFNITYQCCLQNITYLFYLKEVASMPTKDLSMPIT